MPDNSQVKTITRDPWNDLLRQTAVVAVPLDQVLAGLAVPRREAAIVKDELMEQMSRIIEAAGREESGE